MAPLARLVVLYFINLPSLQHLSLNTYESPLMKPHCAINVLNVTFWSFVMNSENQELITDQNSIILKFNNIIHSKGNAIVGGKLVLPATPCRHGRRKGGPRPPWILKISAKKGCFLSFEWEKQISPLLAPKEKFWKNPLFLACFSGKVVDPCTSEMERRFQKVIFE